MFKDLSITEIEKLLKQKEKIRSTLEDDITTIKKGVIRDTEEIKKQTLPITELLQKGLFETISEEKSGKIANVETLPLIKTIKTELEKQGVEQGNIKTIIENLSIKSSSSITLFNELNEQLRDLNATTNDTSNFLYVIAQNSPLHINLVAEQLKKNKDELMNKYTEKLDFYNTLDEKRNELNNFENNLKETKENLKENREKTTEINNRKTEINNTLKKKGELMSQITLTNKTLRDLNESINKANRDLNNDKKTQKAKTLISQNLERYNAELEKAKNNMKNLQAEKKNREKELVNLELEIEKNNNYKSEAMVTKQNIITQIKIAKKWFKDNRTVINEFTDDREQLDEEIDLLNYRINQLQNLTEKKGPLLFQGEGISNIPTKKYYQPKNHPYKILNNMFGNLNINEAKLKGYNLLKVKKGGQVLLNQKVNKDLVDLLTKRFNTRKNYTDESIELFSKLVEMAKIPINRSSQKYQLTKLKQQGGEVNIKIFSSVKDMTVRLAGIISAMNAGNNSIILKNEMRQILDELLKKNTIKKEEHKFMTNKYRL
jgi:hypothetical protein